HIVIDNGACASSSIRHGGADHFEWDATDLVLGTGGRDSRQVVSLGARGGAACEVFARGACVVLLRDVDGSSIGDERSPEFPQGGRRDFDGCMAHARKPATLASSGEAWALGLW